MQAFSNVLGVTEIAVAVMIALRPLSARVVALGSEIAVMMFLTTLSFLLSTSDWEPSLRGFPALSVAPEQFVLKDAVLLGVAVWLLGETLKDVAEKLTREHYSIKWCSDKAERHDLRCSTYGDHDGGQ